MFCVLLTYFIGVAVGTYVVIKSNDQLSPYLVFLGSATSIAISCYSFKAKGENVERIKRGEVPHEDEDSGSDNNY